MDPEAENQSDEVSSSFIFMLLWILSVDWGKWTTINKS